MLRNLLQCVKPHPETEGNCGISRYQCIGIAAGTHTHQPAGTGQRCEKHQIEKGIVPPLLTPKPNKPQGGKAGAYGSKGAHIKQPVADYPVNHYRVMRRQTENIIKIPTVR